MPNPYASIFQGCFSITMSLKPAPLQFHTPSLPQSPHKIQAFALHPSKNPCVSWWFLASPISGGCSASSGACARSLELDWRQRNVALPYLFHQNSRYGGLSYDDFSELDPDREVESAQQPKMGLIFDKPEDGVRKIVLATNMAETAISINDVVFVVDGGKAKETSYDALNNTPCLLPSWISKAAARQRRGRAGRVQSGECYHLCPKCVYDAFPDYQLPELLRTPLHFICLQIKSLQLGNISDFLSSALQPPESLISKFTWNKILSL